MTDSAVTVVGQGDYSDLKVTVGKTKNLITESVLVSWQWGQGESSKVTPANGYGLRTNVLSIFQCWGDDPAGPAREQCQYGGFTTGGDSAGLQSPWAEQVMGSGPEVTTRAIMYSRVVDFVTHPAGVYDLIRNFARASKDPLELNGGYKGSDPGLVSKHGVVPLHPAPTKSKPKPPPILDEMIAAGYAPTAMFNQETTNEITAARTLNGGVGREFFTVQNAWDSQMTRCGDQDGTLDQKPRKCWLVIVPHGERDSNGEPVSQLGHFGSPLSLSKWRNRIVVPLEFAGLPRACGESGKAATQVSGDDTGVPLMMSWAGALCSEGRPIDYIATTDRLARELSAQPGVARDDSQPPATLAMVSSPSRVVTEGAPRPVAVPVAASGVAVAVVWERRYPNIDGVMEAGYEEYGPYLGTRVEQLNLTPRLLAKLLTQSYAYSTWASQGPPGLRPPPEHLAANPWTPFQDKEFLENNKFLDAQGKPIPSADVSRLMPTDLSARLQVSGKFSDALQTVWSYVLADPAARAWLNGEPDEQGMRINPNHRGIHNYLLGETPTDDLPRLDNVCDAGSTVDLRTNETVTAPICPSTLNPPLDSLPAVGAQVSTGSAIRSVQVSIDIATGQVQASAKPRRQPVGDRQILGLSDTPTVLGRGMVAASLRNASGRFVAPSDAAMKAALTHARSVPQSDKAIADYAYELSPASVDGEGYPLTRLHHFTITPEHTTVENAATYIQLIDYAVNKGQSQGVAVGELPRGFVPIPDGMRQVASKAVQQLKTRAGTTFPTGGKPSEDKPQPQPEASNDLGPQVLSDSGLTSSDGAAAPVAESPVDLGGAGGVASASEVPAAPPPATEPVGSVPGGTKSTAQDLINRILGRTKSVSAEQLRWVVPMLLLLGPAFAAAGVHIARKRSASNLAARV